MAPADTRRFAVRAGLAAAAVAGLVAAGAAAPANAAITSFCSGVAGEVTVPGDLIIRANDWCVLEGTTIQGDVTVRAGGDLVAIGATVEGRVTAQPDAYVSIEGTEVSDRVILRDAFGLLVTDSSLGENIAARQVEPDAAAGAVLSIDSSIAGTVNAQVGAVWFGSSQIGGAVLGSNVDYVDIHDTVVNGRLEVSGTTQGSVVCDSEVYGPATYAGNSGPIQLGGDTALAGCESANYWHRNVAVDDSSDVLLAENIIREDLSGSGNTSVAAEGNRVRGATDGQFTDAAPAAGAHLAISRAMIDRGDRLQAQLEARHAAAVQQAQQIGVANL